MRIAKRRRTTITALLSVLGGGFVVALAPMQLGEVRLGGVSVLWWYAAMLGPLAAAAVALLGLARRTR